LPFRKIENASNTSETKNEADKADDAFKILALDDLNSQQVKIFADARGVPKPVEFINAIERADAWPLAARPDDLSELLAYWKEHGRIGNRLELMQSSIKRRLSERDQNRDDAFPLSFLDAHIGAQSLAAAATLAQQSAFRVPDGSAATKGIAVCEILPDWDSNKCAALLSRPIFDEAIYHTVRFHHRTTREYLTAEWFKKLLDQETSRRRIEALFFRTQYGLEVIVPTMRPVLVWLILLDEKIREKALQISPELIFEGGEPKALPPAVREGIISNICETMLTDQVRNSASDYRAIQRFADQDVASKIKELFAINSNNQDVEFFLLRLIWQGEISEALPEAKSVALNTKAKKYNRIVAFRAVALLGSKEDRQGVHDKFLNGSPSLDREQFAALLEELPCTTADIDWFLGCLAKLTPKDRHTVDSLPQAMDEFVARLDFRLLETVVEGMNKLLSKHPIVERHNCEISNRHGWLIKPAAKVIERLIEVKDEASLKVPVLSVLQKLPSAQSFRDWDLTGIKSRLPVLVPEWPELNAALFWYSAKQANRVRRAKNELPISNYWLAGGFHSLWKHSSFTFETALAEVQLRSQESDKLIALSLAWRLYTDAERPVKWLNAMKVAVNGVPKVRVALHDFINPAQISEQEKAYRQQDRRYREGQKRREIAKAKLLQESKEFLKENIHLLGADETSIPAIFTQCQYYLFEKMREVDHKSNLWSFGNWQGLIEEYGEEVSQNFRNGVVKFWRRHTPKLRSEDSGRSGTSSAVIFGLCGLNIEARETNNWTCGLTKETAEIAFRYAMEELNGFPTWLPSVFQAFPDQLTKLLLTEVDYDLSIQTTKTESHYILSDLSWSGSWCWQQIGEGIFERLSAREPSNLGNLKYMLNIIHGSGIHSSRIARLAEKKCLNRRHLHAAHWYAVWVGTDPDAALDSLKVRLKKISTRSAQTKFAMHFITHLLGGRRSVTKVGEAFRTPAHLKTIYLLMHEYIRQKDDINRANKGVYSPILRDDAQDARNQLFNLLKDIPGKESYLALVELAEVHPDNSSRQWMRYHAKAKAESDADLAPWSIFQKSEFQKSIECTPTNHRGLYDLARMRFLDLKDDLENGDSSIAQILINGATQETDMRKYIGNWLRDRAQGRYTIPQEEQLADDKRMDLRFHGVGFDAPVPVELKLAEKWTGPQLFERLENQLCGDYLRDNRSRLGLFILVRRDEKDKWLVPAIGQLVDFHELIAELQNYWQSISEKFPGVDEVRIIGIDLLTRQTSS
jgi:hypothetical protein